MTRYVVLLPGINVGAHNRIGMRLLRDSLRAAGHGEVRTYLQSGNVVLSSDQLPVPLATELHDVLHGEFGLDVEPVVRTSDELADIVARDPFGELADDPKLYQVSFLAAEPDQRGAEQVTSAEVAPERVVISGREIYAWHPHGVQRSKLAALLTSKRLGATVTARNWNTVTALLAMTNG